MSPGAPAADAAAVAGRVIEMARRHVLDEAGRLELAAPQAGARLASVPPVPSCRSAIEIAALDTRAFSRMRFAARCADEPGWQVEYVVRAELSAEVVVAVERIAAARPIAAHEVALERRVLSAGATPLSSVDAVVAQSSRRSIRAGQLVDAALLQAPVLVQRGRRVAIVARNGNVAVSTEGEALASGRRGDIVEVRNTVSGSVIRARVSAENMVEPVGMAIPAPQSPD